MSCFLSRTSPLGIDGKLAEVRGIFRGDLAKSKTPRPVVVISAWRINAAFVTDANHILQGRDGQRGLAPHGQSNERPVDIFPI